MKIEVTLKRDGKHETLELEVNDNTSDQEIDQVVVEHIADLFSVELEKV